MPKSGTSQKPFAIKAAILTHKRQQNRHFWRKLMQNENSNGCEFKTFPKS